MATQYQRHPASQPGPRVTGNWSVTPTTSSSSSNANQHHAEVLRDAVAQVIAPLGLRLAPDKTRVVAHRRRVRLPRLGIRRCMTKWGTTQPFVYTDPVAEGASGHPGADRVAHPADQPCTSTSTSSCLDLNRSIRGWANDFRYGVSSRRLRQARLSRLAAEGAELQRKHGRLSWKEIKRRFCDRGWRFAHNGVVFTRRIPSRHRYRYRGTDPDPVDQHRRIRARPDSEQDTRRARCGENRTAGSGRRPAETDREQCRHRAAGRPH